MAKKKQEEQKAPETGASKLKSIASAFSKHMNNEYQKAVSYVPDVEQIAKVTVSSYLEMGEAFQEAVKLPGLPIGNITHIYGKPDTGKTTILMEAIVNAQKQDILPILILTEHKFDFDRIAHWMEGDPHALLVLHAESIEEIYGYIEKLLKDIQAGRIIIQTEEGNDQEIDIKDQKCFIFVDSIGNTMSDSELEYDVEDIDKSMGKSAKAIKTLTKRVNRLLGMVRQQCGILFLNQSYQSMPSYGPSVETPYGGDGIPYSCVLNIRLRRVKDIIMTISGEDTIIGLETKIEVKKNHITHLKPISTVFTTAAGMVPATKEELDKYKKKVRQ